MIHAGIVIQVLGAFPIQIAVKFKIPLLIWGENVSETSGRDTYGESKYKYDKDFFVKFQQKLHNRWFPENLPEKIFIL